MRIAWGGKDAIKSIVDFPKKYDTEDIIFGPKLSLSAIGRESMQIERRVSRFARSIAIDSSVFDQKACASSHNVFIENLSTSIRLHKITRVIVINHQDCGAAKIVNLNKKLNNNIEEKIHQNSFKKLRRVLNKKFPKIYFEFYLMTLKGYVKKFNV